MKELTISARECLDVYLQKVRARLSGAKTLDSTEIERDIYEHIERELDQAAEPVDRATVESVLERLGAPQQWVPDEELSWWRKIIVRMQSGPDDWRLAYICFALFAFGFILFPLWLVFFLPLSVYIARSTLHVAGGPEALGPQRKLIYPPLVLFYSAIGLLVLLWPLFPLCALADELEREMVGSFVIKSNTVLTQVTLYWLTSSSCIVASMGLWCILLGTFLLVKRKLAEKLIYPFGSVLSKKRLQTLVLRGFAILMLGIIAGTLLINYYGK